MLTPRDRLIVALDVSSAAAARKIVAAVGESVSTFKVGMQLYTAEGPGLVRELVAAGRKVFLDLKYHDIPNTVASAVKEAAGLGVSMLTVHAGGGSKMLRGAVEAAAANPSLIVLAVSVLTSMDEDDLHEISVQGSVEKQVLSLGKLALDAGCQGLVSSAKEAPALRKSYGEKFALITPGVRPAGLEHGDQARVVTPAQAVQAGASHIVVGRPITGAANPQQAAKNIIDEIPTEVSSR
ncbi:MAG TPA: orotidine-5'-phosphate decarboxylase [Terriglobales bacterium]